VRELIRGLGPGRRVEVHTAVDLFCGLGGFGEGFRRAGFRIVAATDCWDAARATYQLNHPDTVFIHGDIRDPAVKGCIVDQCAADLDVITGGFPCQSFSLAGNRDSRDPRGRLFEDYLLLVSRLKPKCCVLENVQGLLSMSTSTGGKVIDVIRDRFQRLDYHVRHAVLDASEYGVPQTRRRLILVATRDRAFDFALLRKLTTDQRLTFRDAVGDLPEVADTKGEAVTYAHPPLNDFQRSMREGCTVLTEHAAPSHSDKLTRMMGFLQEGESAMDDDVRRRMPVELHPRAAFGNSYARIWWDQPAPTITRNFGTPSSANCIHPSQPRGLTIREGARCQSFRDTFKLVGTQSDRRLLVGNAVPPLLAEALGRALGRHLAAADPGFCSEVVPE
jgi:DNA (cytosine-5)-methyltransferase 1